MKRLVILSEVCLMLSTLVIGCGPMAAPPTPYPTYTPYPEPTAYPTYTPYPEPTAYPTYTPYPTPEPQMADLTNLFCEYGFCIGHPTELYLTDIEAPEEWNAYRSGLLRGYNDHGMAVDWRMRTEAEWDAEAEDQVRNIAAEGEVLRDDVAKETMGDFMVTYILLEDTDPDTLRPYSAGAAWHCGDRGFRAVIATKREGLDFDLLKQAVERFTCEK